MRDESHREKTQTSNTQDIKREKRKNKQKQTNRLQIDWDGNREIKSTRTKLFIKKIIKKLI